MADYIDTLHQLLQIENKLEEHFQTTRDTSSISNALLTDKIMDIVALSTDFIKKREQIRQEFVSESSLIIKHKRLRQLLDRIISNEIFLADKVIKCSEETLGHKFGLESLHRDALDFDHLDESKLDEIASEELYSWWGPYDYIWGLVEIGVLIVGVPIPPNLKRYLDEARSCYAFKQYNAVYSLCRTILEASMRDVGIKKGKIRIISDERDFYREYPPHKLINSTTTGRLRARVHEFYDELSILIHGRKTVKAEKAKSALKETISIVQALYQSVE